MNEKVSNLSQIAYVRRYIFTDGNEAGVKIAEVNNGKLRFLLNESKALDVSQLWHEGTNISFVSKNGLTARELPFVRRFEGGMLYACGLDSVGGRDGYELHGSLHNTPATVTRCECNEEKIVVQAEIRDSALFGKNLVLRRTVTTAIQSDTVEIADELCNEGYRDEQYCLLYHVNLGYPMLDENCTIEANIASATPRTPYAEKKQREMLNITAPLPHQEETCYYLTLKEPRISLRNSRLGKTFSLSYSGDTLPHFVEWKSMASGDYALGLEPATTLLDDAFKYSHIASHTKKW
ncbi:MAG: aldose 1-epimerase family protein, partial [Clostridiales bacterium]|nr:aldose 1-epimerase family protein [Clostridiales bacterium]